MKGSREVVAFVGKSKSGKSTLMQSALEQLPRFLIFDTINEYEKISPPFPAVFIREIDRLADYLIKNSSRSTLRIIFSPEDPGEIIERVDETEIKVFDQVSEMLWVGVSDMVFAVEEIANYVKGREYDLNFTKLIRAGRHRNISIYATTQRPVEIKPVMRAAITRLISFYQHSPEDIEAVGEMIHDKKEAETLFNLESFKWPGPMVKGKHYKEYVL